MTRQGALSPLALLLASFLCYGFVLVWTQNVALESTTAFEDLTTPFSSAGVKILTGGNFSVSVAPWKSTTKLADVSAQSGLAVRSSINESATFPMTTTTESQPTMASMSGAEITLEEEFTSTIDSTADPLDTTTNDGGDTMTEDQRSTTELETATETVEGNNGYSTSPSVSAHSNEVSSESTAGSGTTDTTDTTDITDITTTSTSSHRDPLPRAMKKTSSTAGKLSWRVRLRSVLSREEAIKAFYDTSCDVILKKLRMKDVSILVGPDRSPMKCTWTTQ